MRFVIFIVMIMLTAACSLGAGQEDEPQPTEVVIVNTAFPTATPRPTSTPLPGVDDEEEDDDEDDQPTCTVRTDWFTYTVLGGDTLGNIAQRANTTTQNLTIGNCLTNPNLIVPEQRIYVPNVPVAASAIPQSTATPPTVPTVVTLAPIGVEPIKRNDPGWLVIAENTTVRLTWIGFPAQTREVRFYTVPTGTGTWECCRALIGTDSTVSTGTASIFWQTPSAGPIGRLVAEAVDANGAAVALSQAVNVYTESGIALQGGVGITPVLAADAGNILVLRGATATLTYMDAPANAARVRFFYRPDNTNQRELIGMDDNPQDGFMIQWVVPPNLRGILTAEVYNAADDVIAQPVNSNSVYSGPPAGSGCRITANVGLNYYDTPNSYDQTAVGSLNAGDTVETLGRNLGGWWAFDVTGNSGSGGVETLVWLDVNADITEGANC